MCAGTGRIGSPPRRSSSPSRPRRSAGAMTGRTRPPPSGSSPTSVPFSPSTTVIGLRNSVPSEQAEPVRSLTRRIWLSLFFVCPLAWADDSGITPSAFQIVEEEDASPSCAGTILKVSNATLTDNADGSCSVDTGGGGSGDAVTVNSTAIDTTANFKDTTTITWALIDGGVGGPDDAQATAVDVTCTGCLGTTEIAGLDISADTNLTAGDNLTLTDDDLDLDAAVTIGTSISSPIFASTTAGVAAAGILRFANAESINWEAAPAGTDCTLLTDASEVLTSSCVFTATGGITIDATTEGNIETAIDTLANLTAASALVTVGTITTGAWNAGAITSSGIITGNANLTVGNGVSAAASPDTASFIIDNTELSSTTFGAGAFTTMTFDAGATDPVITAASGSLTIAPGGSDLIVADDVEVQDATPHLRLTDTTASEDDFEWVADASQLLLSNVTDSRSILSIIHSG